MIFGKHRKRIDAIADALLDELDVIKAEQLRKYGTYPGEIDDLNWVKAVYLPEHLPRIVKKECGSLIAMLLWTIISAVIQAAIRRWLDNRKAIVTTSVPIPDWAKVEVSKGEAEC